MDSSFLQSDIEEEYEYLQQTLPLLPKNASFSQDFLVKTIGDSKESVKSRMQAMIQVLKMINDGSDPLPYFSAVATLFCSSNKELRTLGYQYMEKIIDKNEDVCLLITGTLLKDTHSTDPRDRMRALKHFSSFKNEHLTEYAIPPILKALSDAEPSVISVAVNCIRRLYYYHPEVLVETTLPDELFKLVFHSNSNVVANALVALMELDDGEEKNLLGTLLQTRVLTITETLFEANEWDKIKILECLLRFTPIDIEVSERLITQLKYFLSIPTSNSAIILTTIKVIINIFKQIEVSMKLKDSVMKKISNHILDCIKASEPEIQYIALKELKSILLDYPLLLEQNEYTLFCRNIDPIYVKLEKLSILVHIATDDNIHLILNEFKEVVNYKNGTLTKRAMEVLVDCCIQLSSSADKIILTISEFLENAEPKTFEIVIPCITKIFAMYPNRYSELLITISKNIQYIELPESKVSIIWLLSEYSETISDVDSIFERYLSCFSRESNQVQHQILTSTMNLFLKYPERYASKLSKLLTLIVDTINHQDIRNRAILYWRMISNNQKISKLVLLPERIGNLDCNENQYSLI